MAEGREFRRSGMQGGQELLPGIPNQITIQNIAPKMTWEAQNVMQLVSYEWRYVLHSRSVYDARVLSKDTEAFLVVVSYRSPGGTIMLLLYSCKHNTCLELPPVPVANHRQEEAECICLDGRIYLWVPGKNPNQSSVSWTEIWMLDLAGDRRWTMCLRGECYSAIDKDIKFSFSYINDVSERLFRNGVLDGRVYRFRGSTRPTDISVFEVHDTDDYETEKAIRFKVKGLPQTEVYDPQSNLLSIITPEPLRNVDVAPTANLNSHFNSFREWERERLQTGPPTIKCYEPFYSEWRARSSTTLAGENECCPRSAMAPQVYHKTLLTGMENEDRGTKNLFFIREKLVRLVDLDFDDDDDDVDYDQTTHGGRGVTVDLQIYDTQEEAWKHWLSFPDPCGGYGGKEECGMCSTYADCEDILSCVFADGVIWILVTECPILSFKDPPAKVALKRSLPFLGKEADFHAAAWDAHAAAWIDTECPMDLILTESSLLRPIYL